DGRRRMPGSAPCWAATCCSRSTSSSCCSSPMSRRAPGAGGRRSTDAGGGVGGVGGDAGAAARGPDAPPARGSGHEPGPRRRPGARGGRGGRAVAGRADHGASRTVRPRRRRPRHRGGARGGAARSHRRGARPALCGGPVRGGAAAHPGDPAQRRRDRPAHVAGTGHRAPGLVRGRRRRPRPRLRHARRGGVRRTAGGPTPLTRPEQAGAGARPETDWGGRGPGTYTRTAAPGPGRADRPSTPAGAPAGGGTGSTRARGRRARSGRTARTSMREHQQVESTPARPDPSGSLRRTRAGGVGLGLPDPSTPGRAGLPVDVERIGPVEECGVFGVWAPGEDVAKLAYYGLYALQHRGQEAAGIAVADGEQVLVYKDLGLVSQVFDEKTLESMHGHVAVGHCRYSTTGATSWDNAQPMFRPTTDGGSVVLGHNGNLVNTHELKRHATELGIRGYAEDSAHSDSDIMATLLAHEALDGGLEEAAARLLPRLRGAYCITFSDEQTLYAARDPHG